jgi:hypothetical protein
VAADKIQFGSDVVRTQQVPDQSRRNDMVPIPDRSGINAISSTDPSPITNLRRLNMGWYAEFACPRFHSSQPFGHGGGPSWSVGDGGPGPSICEKGGKHGGVGLFNECAGVSAILMAFERSAETMDRPPLADPRPSPRGAGSPSEGGHI